MIDDFSVGSPDNLPQDCDYTLSMYQAVTFGDCDAVIHLAASVGEEVCDRRPRCAVLNNVNGVLEMLETIKRLRNPPHMVFASSLVVYGDQEGPWAESVPHRPLGTYAMTKCAGEHLLAISGLSYTVLRFSNIYGLGKFCREGSLTGRFAKCRARGEPLPIWGDGTQRVDMVHVRDVARACLYFAEHRIEGTFNIGSGTHLSVMEVAQLFSSDVVFPRPDYVIPHHRCVWVEKAADVGWQASQLVLPAAQELIHHAAA